MKTEPFLASSASALLKKLQPYNSNKPKLPRSSSIEWTPTPEKDDLQKLINSLHLIRGIDELQDNDPEYYDQAEQLKEEVLETVKDIVYGFNELADEIGTQRFLKILLQWAYFTHLTHYLPSEFDWRAKEIKNRRGTYNVTKKKISFGKLKRRYIDLPYNIRPCFVYCSIFPKGHKIVRENLINLWMAEGLLSPPSSSGEDLEDIGNHHFYHLLSEGFFKEPTLAFGSGQEEEKQKQVVYSCDMCDDMNGFAKEIAGKEVFNAFGKKKYSSLEGLELTRRLALDKNCFSEKEFLKGHWNESRVRTCVFFGSKPQIRDFFLEEITWMFERLVVLDLSGTEFKELPRSTRRLKHLRYLSLSRNGMIEILPYRLYELKYLQTLVLDGCHQLQELPTHVSDLTRLRNLYLTSKDNILSEVILSRWRSLKILELSHCKRLTSLSSEGIKSLVTLRTLRIFNCPRLASLPKSLTFLTCIEELVLHDCPELDFPEPKAFEGLLNLRALEIVGLPKLVELPMGLQSATTLRYLFIANCRNLVDLSGVLSYLTSLQKLCMYDCVNLLALAERLSVDLQLVDIRGCPELSKKFESKEELKVISHSHNIIIDGQWLQKESKPAVKLTGDINEASTATSTDDAPAVLNVPRSVPFFYLKLQSLGMVIEDSGDKRIQEEPRLLDQEPQSGTYDNNSSVKTLVDVIARMKDSILAKNHNEEKSDSSETESPVNSPPVIQSMSHQDQVEAKLLCSLFPKDYEFERETIIQLWMAEGYLKNEPFEDEGERIFESLLSEGCIRESRTDNLTGKKKYISNVNGVSPIYHTEVGDRKPLFDHISQETLHMAMAGDKIDMKDLEELKKFRELRTFLFLRDYGSHVKKVPLDFIESLKCLQALDLSGTHITELPNSIGKSMKLRYLDLSGSRIKSLPETIGNLHNLQTLKLRGCVHLFELPKGITKLMNLRHLDFDILGQLTVMPRGIGALSALRTLMAFIVDGKGHFSNIGELKFLNNLTGSFCISGLEHIEDPEDAKKAALKDKKHLNQLELRWSDIVQDWSHKEAEVLAHLEPSKSLQELQILCFPGILLPSWVGQPSFNSLHSITFLKCKNLILPPLGKLPALKYLEIVELNNVAKIDRDFCGGIMDNAAFPRLEKLVIDGMFILETWEGVNDGDFPYLAELSVKFCPNLNTLPMLPHLPPLKHLELSNCASLESLPEGRCLISLETLLIEDCPLVKKRYSGEGDYWDKVKHVPNVWVDGLEEIVESAKEAKIGSTEEYAEDKVKGDDPKDIKQTNI